MNLKKNKVENFEGGLHPSLIYSEGGAMDYRPPPNHFTLISDLNLILIKV